MITGPINGLSYLQSVLSTSLRSAGLTSSAGKSTSSSLPGSDNSQLSQFAQILGSLQQLQQSNPAGYRQLSQQVSSNLLKAARTAQSEGNTAAATQLNQLSSDFSSASTSGQLPNIQDLAQAAGGQPQPQHHHHHHGGSGSESSSLSTLLAAFQSSATTTSASDALNPLSIISNTLSSQ
jgi:hypothetical protein